MKKAFTLVELLVVVSIFTFLFGAILTVLTSSNRSWRTGQNRLVEQQEARKAMDSIAKLLRQSNPDWVVEKTNPDHTIIKAHYPVTITSDNKRIDFYKAFLYPGCCPDKCGEPAGSDNSVCDDLEGTRHSAGDIIVSKVTFKLNPEPQGLPLFQLLKKEGTADPVPVGDYYIEDINFAWSDACDATCFSSVNCGISDCNDTICNACCSCYRRDSLGQPVCATGIQVRINTKKEKGFTLNSKITLRNQGVALPEDVEVSQPGTGEF